MNQTAEIIEFSATEIKAFDKFESELAELKKLNSSLTFDYASKNGNKDARSHVYKLRKTKSALDTARKEEKDAALQYGRRVDARAKEIREEIEAMIEVHEAPLREIEEKEKKRVADIKEKIANLEKFRELPTDANASQISEELAAIESFKIDDYLDEFKEEAAIGKDKALNEVKQLLAQREKYEAEQAELERLRKEEEQRKQKEREEQIAKDAEERARKEAEEKAVREAKAREEQEEKERLEREKREAERQAELERAQREKAEAEKRAAQAEREAKEKAEREQLEKQEAERKAKEEREANAKHKAKIDNQVQKAIRQSLEKRPDTKPELVILEAIADGRIPNVTINY